jgi:hypothetical protein
MIGIRRIIHSVEIGGRWRFSFEKDFDVGPQEFSNAWIQKNKINENEDAARCVEQLAAL